MGLMKTYLWKFHSTSIQESMVERESHTTFPSGLVSCNLEPKWERYGRRPFFHDVLDLKTHVLKPIYCIQGGHTNSTSSLCHCQVGCHVPCHMARNLLNIEGCGFPRLVLDSKLKKKQGKLAWACGSMGGEIWVFKSSNEFEWKAKNCPYHHLWCNN